MTDLETLKAQEDALNAILGKKNMTKEDVLPTETEKVFYIPTPLSYAEAKAKLFPGNNVQIKKFSPEHMAILQLMRESKERFEEVVKNPDTVRVRLGTKTVKFTGSVSKTQFLSIKSLKEEFLANLEIVKKNSAK